MAHTGTSSGDADSLEYVTDPTNDIAQHVSLERLRVNCRGHQKLQKRYVWLGPNGMVTGTNDKVGDALPDWQPNNNATLAERTPSDQKAEMLVLGLISLDHPRQYSTKTSGAKSKKRDLERKSRGVLEQTEKYGRALVQVTEYTVPYLAYFVALSPVHNVPEVKRTPLESIYFFGEFLPDEFDSYKINERPTAIGKICKKAAAKIKHEEKQEKILIGDPEDK